MNAPLASPFATALAQLETLVARHAQALVQGEADALPELNRQIQQRLALLSAAWSGNPLPADCGPVLQRLRELTQLAQPAAARRREATEQALAVLGASHAGVQQRQAARVYGARGAFAAPAWRSGSLERA